MSIKNPYKSNSYPRTLIVGINAPYNRTGNIDAYFDEFLSLIKTFGVPYQAEYFTKLRSVDNAYFLTKGKLYDLKDLCAKNEI